MRRLYPHSVAARAAGWHLARQLAVRRRVRGQHDRPLPGARTASRAPGRWRSGPGMQTAPGPGTQVGQCRRGRGERGGIPAPAHDLSRLRSWAQAGTMFAAPAVARRLGYRDRSGLHSRSGPPPARRAGSCPSAWPVAVRTWNANRSRSRYPSRPVPPRARRTGRHPAQVVDTRPVRRATCHSGCTGAVCIPGPDRHRPGARTASRAPGRWRSGPGRNRSRSRYPSRPVPPRARRTGRHPGSCPRPEPASRPSR